MTFFTKQGSFVCPAATGNQTITLGWQPDAIFFWQCHQTNSGDAANGWWGFGAWGGLDACSYGSQNNNTSTTSACNSAYTGARATGIINPASAVVMSNAQVSNTSSTGFTMTWNQVTSGDIIHFLAIGGTDVQSIGASLTARTTTGQQVVSGLGFQPKMVVFIYGNNVSTGGAAGFGFATSSSSRFACSMSQAVSASMSSTAFASRIQDTTKCISILNNGGVTTTLAAADLVSLDPTGFTLNWTTATTTAFGLAYVAIGGSGQFAVGTITKAANTSATTETVNAGFVTAPGAYLTFCNGTTNNTAQSTGWRTTIGGSDGTAANAISAEVKNGVINTQCRKFNDPGTNALWASIRLRALPASVSAAGATEVQLAHNSFTSNGFVMSYITNGVTTQYVYPWVAFASAPITEPTNPLAGPVDAFANSVID